MESDTASAINQGAANFASLDTRDQERRWRGYWSKFWCFGSHKRSNKQIVPSLNPDGTMRLSQGWAEAGSAQAGLSLAPPSSPASIINSSIQSPASFTLPLSAASECMFSPGPAKLMFTIGPYAYETQLVSPPVFSTFTTEPSTASLTPHPELAHLTTPPSPDVSFAQLLASSLKAKSQVRKRAAALSPLSLASPSDVMSGELKSSFQGLPDGESIFPASGYLDSGTSSPFPEVDFNAHFGALSQGTSCDTAIPQNHTSIDTTRPVLDDALFNQEEQHGRSVCTDSTPEEHHDQEVAGLSASCPQGLSNTLQSLWFSVSDGQAEHSKTGSEDGNKGFRVESQELLHGQTLDGQLENGLKNCVFSSEAAKHRRCMEMEMEMDECNELSGPLELSGTPMESLPQWTLATL